MRDERSNRRNRAVVEGLEARQLLSAATVSPHASPAGVAVPAAGTIPIGGTSPTGYTPAQIRGAYGIANTSFNGTAGSGAGQTIAIIVAYDNPMLVDTGTSAFGSSDLALFDQQFGIANPPSVVKVSQTGSGTALPAVDPTGQWTNEAALDVEWVHAIAPAANILLVEANSDGLNDLVDGAVAYARTQPGVSVVTMSFAAPEAASETSYDPEFTTPAGHAGITFVAASGDLGSPGGYPAFSPNVVGVGGTTTAISGSNTLGTETGRTGSGGGVSQFEPKPSWQFGVTQSGTNRTEPDVSFDADPNTGVAVYDSYNGGVSNPWYKVGGTSFAAPVWAGLIATADQGRARLGLSSLDGTTQTLPRLYQLRPSDFHDVTAGNNGFAAGTGYDLVTGRGTPVANQLVPDLAGGNTLKGFTFLDNNANATQDNGEPGLARWGVYLDLYGRGVGAGGDPAVNTGPIGGYTFGDLAGGTYVVSQFPLPGFTKTTPNTYTVTVGYGATVTGKNFGEHFNVPATGTITGYVFQDNNNNRVDDAGDGPLTGTTVYLDRNNDGVYDAGDTLAPTGPIGGYRFTGLATGTTYHVRQDIPAGYSRTTLGGGLSANVTLDAATYTLNIGYVPDTATISGHVFADANGDGTPEAGEANLSGFGVYLDLDHNGAFTPGVDVRVFTDPNGNYTIAGVGPGTFVLNEGVPAGYRRTGVATTGYTVVVGVGAVISGRNFGNQLV